MLGVLELNKAYLSTLVSFCMLTSICMTEANDITNISTPQIQSSAKNNHLKKEEREIMIKSYAYDTKIIEDNIRSVRRNTSQDNIQKVAFLTFDDGPSTTNTPKILDVLKAYNVKATFFILGEQLDNDSCKAVLKRMYNEGHAIGNHTFCHDYKYLYPNRYANANHIIKDLKKNESVMKEVLGQDFHCSVVRLPGGFASWKNTKALKEPFKECHVNYVDWNVLNGDAEGYRKNKEQLIARFNQTFKEQDIVVVLMHDTYGKESTVEALPYIIEKLQSKGYNFGILN